VRRGIKGGGISTYICRDDLLNSPLTHLAIDVANCGFNENFINVKIAGNLKVNFLKF
jgi:hypothetical protein